MMFYDPSMTTRACTCTKRQDLRRVCRLCEQDALCTARASLFILHRHSCIKTPVEHIHVCAGKVPQPFQGVAPALMARAFVDSKPGRRPWDVRSCGGCDSAHLPLLACLAHSCNGCHACMRPQCHQLSTRARLSQSAFVIWAADSRECSAVMLCLLLQKDVTEQLAAAASSATAAAGAPEPRALASSRQAGARAAPLHAATQRTSPTAATSSFSARAAARTQQHSQLQRTATNACLKPCMHWRHASMRGVCVRSNRGCRVHI